MLVDHRAGWIAVRNCAAALSCAFAWSCMEEERMEKRVICRAGLSQAMLPWRMCLALLVRDFAGLVDFYISQQKADEVFIHLLCIDTVFVLK